MKLFDTESRIGLTLDSYKPITEKRRGSDVQVLDLTLSLTPLTSELAALLGEGMLVKRTLFRISTGEPLPNLSRVAFDISVPRQTLNVYAAPDVPVARMCLSHVLIKKLTAKNTSAGWGLTLHAVTDQLNIAELEAIYAWYTHTQFVTFHESEPLLEQEDDGAPDEEGTDADTKARDVVENGHRYPEKKKRGRPRKVNPDDGLSVVDDVVNQDEVPF